MRHWTIRFLAAALVVVVGFCVTAHGQKILESGTDRPAPVPTSKSERGVATGAETDKKAAIPVITETVVTKPLNKTLEATGSVVATRLARLASPVEGPAVDCRVREGDFVRRGERLLSIGRNTAAQAQLTAAQAAFKEQELELARMTQLVRSGAVPAAQLDTARSKFENARAQLAKAKESAGDYSVAAPWEGIVGKVLVRDGDFVAPRAALVEMFDPGSLVIRFAVPEAQATELRRDLSVVVQLDAYPGKSLKGRVQRVYPELDTRMRTRIAEAVLEEPVELIPGMFARLVVHLASVPDALMVPSEGVLVSPRGERFLFVVENGKAVRREVETGIEQNGRIWIVTGLQSGEQVVVAGNEKLKSGVEVRVQEGGGQ